MPPMEDMPILWDWNQVPQAGLIAVRCLPQQRLEQQLPLALQAVREIFPSRFVCLRDCYYVSFSNARPTVSANIPVYVRRKAARLGPNLFKTSGFLANYGSKPIISGVLATTIIPD